MSIVIWLFVFAMPDGTRAPSYQAYATREACDKASGDFNRSKGTAASFCLEARLYK